MDQMAVSEGPAKGIKIPLYSAIVMAFYSQRKKLAKNI